MSRYTVVVPNERIVECRPGTEARRILNHLIDQAEWWSIGNIFLSNAQEIRTTCPRFAAALTALAQGGVAAVERLEQLAPTGVPNPPSSLALGIAEAMAEARR